VLASYFWVLPLLLPLGLILAPVWWYLAHNNIYTNDVLYSGWTPIVGAMVISRLVLIEYSVVYPAVITGRLMLLNIHQSVPE